MMLLLGSFAGSFDFAQDDDCASSLQLGRKFADQVLDLFRFVAVTN
jgi:hypothetical protein